MRLVGWQWQCMPLSNPARKRTEPGGLSNTRSPPSLTPSPPHCLYLTLALSLPLFSLSPSSLLFSLLHSTPLFLLARPPSPPLAVGLSLLCWSHTPVSSVGKHLVLHGLDQQTKHDPWAMYPQLRSGPHQHLELGCFFVIRSGGIMQATVAQASERTA